MNRACRSTTIHALAVLTLALLLAAGCATAPDGTNRAASALPSDSVADGDPDEDGGIVSSSSPASPARPETALERRDPPAVHAERPVDRDVASLDEPDVYMDDSIARREALPADALPGAREVASPRVPRPPDPRAVDTPAAAQSPAAAKSPVDDENEDAASDRQPAREEAAPGRPPVAFLAEPLLRESAGASDGTETPAKPAEAPAADSSTAPAERLAADAPAGDRSEPAAAPEQRRAAPPEGSASPRPREPAEPAAGEPREPAEPTGPAEPTEPAAGEPAEPIEPAAREPAEPIEPAAREPARPREPAAAPGPTWNERSVRVGADGEIVVVLPGKGWLYVGREYGDGEVTFIDKRGEDDGEAFRFRVAGPGSYGLWFQQQDSQSGRLVNERLGVDAVPGTADGEVRVADLAVDGHDEADAAGERTADSFAGAVRSDEAGGSAATAEALPDSVRGAVPDEREETAPSSEERIAALLSSDDSAGALRAYADAGDRRGALIDSLDEDQLDVLAAAITPDTPAPVVRAFWSDVASSGSRLAPRARRELYELALASEAAEEALRAVEQLEAAGEASAADVLRAASLLESDEQREDALPLYARALAGAREGSAAERRVMTLGDDRLFELARFLEAPGPERDLRAAARLYRVIVDERPLSAQWEASRSRLEHLRRHYFEVR